MPAGQAPSPRSGPYTAQPHFTTYAFTHFRRSEAVKTMYHQQTKNLLVSYSPKKLGFF